MRPAPTRRCCGSRSTAAGSTAWIGATCAASPKTTAGGPVGVETMAAALGDERDVIEEVVEPYLIQEGFVQRTPRGRMLTRIAFRHLDLPMPASLPAQLDLLARLPFDTEVEETP